MINLKMLSYINRRLRQIYAKPKEQFSSISVVLFSDFYQLLPVSSKLLFSSTIQNKDELNRRTIYLQFTITVKLTQLIRQDSTNPTSLQFKAVLKNIRNNQITRDDQQFLLTRAQVPIAKRQQFEYALRVLPYKKKVNIYNEQRIRTTSKAIRIIKARYTSSKGIVRATFEEGGNLYSNLPLSISCRVMLTKNIQTERSLTNSAISTLINIVQQKGDNLYDVNNTKDFNNVLPLYLLITFDNYDYEHNNKHKFPSSKGLLLRYAKSKSR